MVTGCEHQWVYENPDHAKCRCGWELRHGLQKLTREPGPDPGPPTTLMVTLTVTLSEEDLENMHLALGIALAALTHLNDREMANRARRRLEAMHYALCDAERARSAGGA